jgi:hypothetical protein
VEEGVIEADGPDEGGVMGGTDGGAGAVAVVEMTGIDDNNSGGRTDGSVIGDDENEAEMGEAEDEKRERKVKMA